MDELESKLLGESPQPVLRELFGVYNELMILRRTLVPHREILSRLNREDVPFITAIANDLGYEHLPAADALKAA